jgi:hypothetical protein
MSKQKGSSDVYVQVAKRTHLHRRKHGPLRRRCATGVGRDSKGGDVHKPDSMRKAKLFYRGRMPSPSCD